MSNNRRAAEESAPRLGPNSVTRLLEALRNLKGEARARDVFRAAGLLRYYETPPATMVPEADVKALHRALFDAVPRNDAERLLTVAGVLTARYLLANRIPRLAQSVIRRLPAAVGGRLLLAAIQKNAWTFAGSAEARADRGRHPALVMQKCLLCRGLDAAARPCHYHKGTIETIFRALVSPQARVTIDAFSARRSGGCAFDIVW